MFALSTIDPLPRSIVRVSFISEVEEEFEQKAFKRNSAKEEVEKRSPKIFPRIHAKEYENSPTDGGGIGGRGGGIEEFESP